MSEHDYGPRPEMRDVPIGSLFVDETYQRDMVSRRSQALVERIIQNFRWAKFGVVQVAPWAEKNGFAIIDGQHRVEAARRIGIAKVPCLVYEGLSAGEAAAVFVDVNRNRVAVHPMAMHHALLAAGDPDAITVDRVCRAAGVTITRYPIQLRHIKPGQTMAVGAIARCISQFGEATATNAITILSEAFEGQSGRIRADVIRGACAMLAKHEDGFDRRKRDDLVRWLRQIEHVEFYAEVRRVVDETGLAGFVCAATVLARAIGLERRAPVTPVGVSRPVVAPMRDPIVVDDPDEMFDTPKNRRCQACSRVFSTRRVHQHRCDRCSEESAA